MSGPSHSCRNRFKKIRVLLAPAHLQQAPIHRQCAATATRKPADSQRQSHPAQRHKRLLKANGKMHRPGPVCIDCGNCLAHQHHFAPPKHPGGEHKTWNRPLPREPDRRGGAGLVLYPLHHRSQKTRRRNQLLPLKESGQACSFHSFSHFHLASSSSGLLSLVQPRQQTASSCCLRCGKRLLSSACARASLAFTVPSGRCMVLAAAATSIS